MGKVSRFTLLVLALLANIPLEASAQTPSAEELKAQIDQRMADLESYRELLDQPDPMQSLAAMEVMLASGDSTLQRMALDFGLYSPDPGLRRKALEGFFNSGPSLAVTFDPSGLEGDFDVSMNQVSGSVSPDGKGFATFLVGEFNPEQNCWMNARTSYCLVSLTEASISVLFYGDWGQGQLQDDGTVNGFADLARMSSIPFSFPVAF